jgi:Arc/MetJ-type ribon-helix-helix transcriptional regulator
MRSRAIIRELVRQLLEADADKERRKRMRKILKTRNLPDEDDEDPIDADPMRSFLHHHDT